jgi:predicted metalloprotease
VRRAAAAVVAAVAVAVAACTTSTDVRTVTAGPIPTTAPTTSSSETTTTSARTTTSSSHPGSHVPADDPNRPPQSYDAVVDASIGDIRAFWSREYPAVYGEPYRDLRGGIWAMYPGVTGVPGCGGRPITTYRLIRGNAFYCRGGDFIAFDDATLFPEIDQSFGPFVLGLILAHEWGHGIQFRAGVPERPTIVLEQQADCFAGAWVAHLKASPDSPIKLTDTELNAAFGGMLRFRDELGTSAQDTGAHGSGFDRVGAFQDGFANGAKQCATYPKDPPTVVELPFTSAEDQANKGNLAFDRIVPAAVSDLDRFWTAVYQQRGSTYRRPTGGVKAYPAAGPYPPCPNQTRIPADYQGRVFYCRAGDYVAYDQDSLRSQVYDIGDFAVAALIADAWSTAMQDRLAVTQVGTARVTQADCMTGAWARDSLPGPNQPADKLVLSPGDLDEALIAFLQFASARDPARDDTAITFNRLASFRTGFLKGLDACGLP